MNVVAEATWHDNSVADTDIAPPVHDANEVTYDQREGISLGEAVLWAMQLTCPVTLYIYDEGAGI